jgi:hypothetical protein
MSKTARCRAEDGATLVELLVAITISGVIASAMAAAFFVVAHHRDSAEDRLARSNDAQFVANYVVADAQSSGDQSLSDPEVSITDASWCSSATPPAAGSPTPVVRFKWFSTTPSGAQEKIVNYLQVGNTVWRRHCSEGALVSDVRVAQSVESAVARCTPISEPDCLGNPTGVEISVRETLGAGETTNYEYSLPATFRKLSANEVPPRISAALITLGDDGLSITSAAARLTIDTGGTIISNSNIELFRPTSLTSPLPAIQLFGTMTCGSDTCPPTTPITQPVIDPYQWMTCPYTDLGGTRLPEFTTGNSNRGPGVYYQELRLSGDEPLARGRYVLKAGVRKTSGGAVTGTGVLVCVEGGSYNMAGGGSVSLSPLETSGTSPFAGIVVFQPRTNPSTMTLRGGGGGTYTGLVYAGGATVDLGGGGSLLSDSVIANAATLGGSSSATLG